MLGQLILLSTMEKRTKSGAQKQCIGAGNLCVKTFRQLKQVSRKGRNANR